MIPGRGGAALVAVLLLLLTATGLAHGALLLGRSELVASRARAARAADASRAAVELARGPASAWSADLGAMPVWASRVLDTVAPPERGVVRVLRLSRESWWLEHAADSTSQRRLGSPGRLLWWLDPASRLRALGAVLTVGAEAPVALAGVVDRTSFARVPTPLAPEACEEALGGQPPDFAPAHLLALAEGEGFPSLGLLGLGSMLERTAIGLEGTGAPGPSDVAGVCRELEPWSWGDPEHPEAPCGDAVVVRAALAGLGVDGGSGQAALVIDGDLELSGDARIYGFVMVTGVLRVLGSAELHGVAVAFGGVELDPGARIVGSACWAGRALRAAREVWMPSPAPVPGSPPIGP